MARPPQPRITVVTCTALPEPDVDEAPLLAALRERGADARVAAWDDPAVDWSQAGLAVLRSTWNYHHQVDAFVAWCERVAAATDLRNPVDVVRWNAHKRYMLELERAGLPTVPTTIFAPGDDAALPGEGDVVIKPAVSAGSFATERFDLARAGARAEEHLARILGEGREAMVQPYQHEVAASGERALVWIGGELTHAVRKRPRFGSDAEAVEPVPIEPDERSLAHSVLDHVGTAGLRYARVDVVRDERGEPRIMELELIEPSLFLVQHAPALERFADLLVRAPSGD